MKILAIDIGGTHVKVLATGRRKHLQIDSGPTMTPKRMAAAVRAATAGWKYEAVSIGYPGPVVPGHPVAEPHNLGRGWVGFNFRKAVGHRMSVDHRTGIADGDGLVFPAGGRRPYRSG